MLEQGKSDSVLSLTLVDVRGVPSRAEATTCGGPSVAAFMSCTGSRPVRSPRLVSLLERLIIVLTAVLLVAALLRWIEFDIESTAGRSSPAAPRAIIPPAAR